MDALCEAYGGRPSERMWPDDRDLAFDFSFDRDVRHRAHVIHEREREIEQGKPTKMTNSDAQKKLDDVRSRMTQKDRDRLNAFMAQKAKR